MYAIHAINRITWKYFPFSFITENSVPNSFRRTHFKVHEKKPFTSSNFIRQGKNLFLNLFVNTEGVSKSLVVQKNKPKQKCRKLWALLWQQHMGYIQGLWRTVLLSNISLSSLSKSFDNICVNVVKRCFFNNYVSTSTF